jgi:hypothetical protein
MPKKKADHSFKLIDQHDLGTLLVCSVRYAIARNTYMPLTIQHIINRHVNDIHPHDAEVIVRTIEEELKWMQQFRKDEDSINQKIKDEEAVQWGLLVEKLRNTQKKGEL